MATCDSPNTSLTPDDVTASEQVGHLPKSRVILVGDSGTGKTSLVRQLATGEFDPMCTPTIGIDYHMHVLKYSDIRSELPEQQLVLDIWDSAGQERFRAISVSYFKNISGVLLVFDLSNPKTFRNLESWMSYVYEHTKEDSFVFLVVGSKSDLPHKVSKEEITEFCSSKNLEYLEVSSLDTSLTSKVFFTLGRQMLEKRFYRVPHDDTPLEECDRTLSLHTIETPEHSRTGSRSCCVLSGRRTDKK